MRLRSSTSPDQARLRSRQPHGTGSPARDTRLTRKTDETCTKKVVITLDDGKKLERDLPLDMPVEIAVTFPEAGKLTYACSMNMSRGTIVVQ